MGSSEKMPVRREDLYEFRFLSEPVLSPGGTMAVYIVSRADKEKNQYAGELWLYDEKTGENRLLASRGGAKNPQWMDEEHILFSSGRDGKEGMDYYKISVSGGEAEHVLTLPVKAEKLVILGENDYLVQAVEDCSRQEGEEGKLCAVRGQDYEIYEELPFWFNGKGIRSRKRAALYRYRAGDESPVRISEPFQEVESFCVSPDQKLVAFCGPVYESVKPRTSALYVYDTVSAKITKLTADDQYETEHLCFFGNSRIFYTGTTYERVGKHPRYYFYDLEKNESVQLPFCDSSVGNGVGSDAKYGSGKAMAYCGETNRLYMIQTSWGDSSIAALKEDGQIESVSRQPGAITGFDTAAGKIVMTAMRGDHLAELYALSPETGEEKKLTGFNDQYLDTHKVMTPQAFRYESRNGYVMEGYAIHPIDYMPGKQYPAVLEIHGGPKAAFGSVFFHEMQCLASDGFFVIFTNPRGSDGRGEAFADITEVFGKDDFEDLTEFTDQALDRYPDIDRKRVAICGGSYGGFMCNWMVGHTDRYAAAVSQRSISNYLTKCLYTDIGYYANRLQMGAFPWENFQKVWDMSPLKEAPRTKTPLLLIQSDEDYRCWMGDAVQMFSAVKRSGTPVRMILFHGENHELSRSGKPENRITRLKELEKWIKTYCIDKNT